MYARTLDRVIEKWFEPVDPIRLDLFRRLFCATLLLYNAHRFLHPYEWLTAQGFHSSRWTIDTFGAPYSLVMPPALVPLFGLLLFGSLLALVAGRGVRLAAWVALGCSIYAQIVDRYSAFTMDKLAVVTLLVFAVSPAPRRLPGEPGGAAVAVQSAWPIRVFQGKLILLYFTAAVAKCYGDWLVDPDVLWASVQGGYGTDFNAFLLRNLPKGAWTGMQHASLAFEALAPLLFIVKRLRPLGIVWGTGFHLMIGLTMHMLILFSLQMISYYVLFIDAGTLRRFATRARRLVGPDVSPESAAAPV